MTQKIKKWIIKFSESAYKDLKKLPPRDARRIEKFLKERIETHPHPYHLAIPLAGILRHYWRFRVGDYRLICEFHEERVMIMVIRLGHRRDIYD